MTFVSFGAVGGNDYEFSLAPPAGPSTGSHVCDYISTIRFDLI